MRPPTERISIGLLLALVLLAAASPCPTANAAKGTSPDTSPISLANAPNWSAGGIAWARPLEAGTLRGLMIAPPHALRDAVELSRQIDIELHIAAVREHDDNLDTAQTDALLAQLDGALDVIILADIAATTLSIDLQNALIKKVREGTGLVRVRYGSDPFPTLQEFLDTLKALSYETPVTRGIGNEDPFGLQPEPPALRLYEGPGARVVELGYAEPRPKLHCLIPALADAAVDDRAFLNAQFSAVARAVLWAARRDPAVTIQRVDNLDPQGPDEGNTPPNLPQEFVQTMQDAALQSITHQYRVQLSVPAPEDYSVRVRVRYPHKRLQWSRILDDQTGQIKKGSQSHSFYIPHANGDCLLDVWLLDKDAVVDWYTLPVHVEGWPEISNVEYSKFAVKSNDSLTVSLDLRPHFHRPGPATIYARASDPLGKVVAEKYVGVSPDGGRVQATLTLTNLDVEQLRIEVFVADRASGLFGSWELEHSAHHVGYVPVVGAPKPPFRFIVDGIASTEPNVRGINRALAEIGVDTIHLLPDHPDAMGLTLDNLGVIPNLAPDRPGEAGRFQRDAAAYSALGADRYCLVDLSAPSEQGEEPTPGKSDSPKAIRQQIQSRRAADSALLNRYRAARTSLREVDESAHLGLYDPVSSASAPGPDWQQLAAQVDFLRISSDRSTVETVRSFSARDQLGFIHLNDSAEPPTLMDAQRLPWFAALHDLNGVWVSDTYGMAGADPTHTALSPDGRAAPWFVETARSVAEVRTGYGTLFAAARRANSGIAILSSRASARFNAAVRESEVDSAKAESVAFKLIEGLGYQFDMLSGEQLRDGNLAEYNVLMLPAARALGDLEIEAIVTFTGRGGTVIADIVPGRFDADGTPRTSNPLAPVFGVGRGSKTQPNAGPLMLLLPVPSAKRNRAPLPTLNPDTSVFSEADSVEAHVGDTPVWLLHNTGEGQAILLNHALSDAVESPLFRGLFDDWLTRGGAQKVLPELFRKGTPYQGERVLYHYGEAQIVALLSDPTVSEPVQKLRPVFPEDRHTYAMRSGEAIRRSKTAVVKLARGEVGLYSSLPYEVSRVLVSAPRAVSGGRVPVEVSVRTRERLPGRHLIFLSLAPRNGKGPALESKTLECPDGQGETYLSVPLNTPPGEYLVTARDILTGITGSVPIVLVSSLP